MPLLATLPGVAPCLDFSALQAGTELTLPRIANAGFFVLLSIVRATLLL